MLRLNSKWKSWRKITGVVFIRVPQTTQNVIIWRSYFCRERKRNVQRFITHVHSYCFVHENLLFSDVLIAGVVVVCLSSLVTAYGLGPERENLTGVIQRRVRTLRERVGSRTGLALRIIAMWLFRFVSFIGFTCYDCIGTGLIDAMPLLISAVDRNRSRDEFELCQRES